MSERSRIIYVTEYYPPFGAGGAERTASLHARLLVRSGQPVTVVTPNYGATPRELVDGVDVIRFPFTRLSGQGRQVSPFRFFAPGYHRELAGQVLRAVGDRPVRCLHAQNTHSTIGTDLAAQHLSVPLVTHIRDTAGICGLGALCLMEPGIDAPPSRCGIRQHAVCHVTRYLPNYQRGAGMKGYGVGTAYTAAAYLDFLRRRRVYRRAARIAFASEGLRQVYRHVRDFQDESTHRVVHAPVIEDDQPGAVPNGLPPAVDAAKRSGAPLLLYVGKVSRGKGAEVLAAVQQRLRARLPAVRLVIAGHMDHARWGFDSETTVSLGFVDGPTLRGLYAACDVVVLPSIWPEPLGWATLEAGRHAKPIVAMRVGGIPEGVVDGETGILVDKLDVHGMCEALEALLRDPSRRHAMGQRARQFVLERFGEAAVQRELDALYEGL